MLHHFEGNFEHVCNLLIMVLFSENKFVFLALLQYIYLHGRVLHTFLVDYAPNGRCIHAETGARSTARASLRHAMAPVACLRDARAVLRAPVLTCIHRPFGA